MIEAALQRFTRAELLHKLRAAHIPAVKCVACWRRAAVERTQEAGLLHHFDDSEAHQAVLAPPYAMDGQRLPVRRPPPHLGQHTTRCCTTAGHGARGRRGTASAAGHLS